jgi:ArsR family transcriptional regulator
MPLAYICQDEYIGAMDRALAEIEDVFKALADQTRLRIVGLLSNGEVCVCDIHESLGLPQPKVSRHLAYLKRAGLVEDRKAGLWVHYRLATPRNDLLRSLLSSVGHWLHHVPSTERDLKRLEKRTGGRIQHAGKTLPIFSCCEATSESRMAERRGSGVREHPSQT